MYFDGQLYYTLGVTQSATPEQIRKAYDKLSKETDPALNPDNPDAEAEFQELNEAYTILADLETKAVYDQLGRDAVDRYMQIQNAPPSEVQFMVADGNMPQIQCVFCVVALILTLFTVLVAMVMNGDLHTKWIYTFIPLYFLLGVVALVISCGFYGSFVRSAVEGLNDEMPPFLQGTYRITTLFLITLLPVYLAIFFFVLLPLKLDGTITWKWHAVFAPTYYLPVRDFVQALMMRENDSRGKEMMPGEVAPGVPQAVAWLLIKIICLTIFLLKLDDAINWDWAVVAAPVFVYSTVSLTVTCVSAAVHWRHSRDMQERAEAGAATFVESNEAMTEANNMMATACSSVGPLGCLFVVFAVLVMLRVKGDIDSNYFVLLTPVWILLAMVMCCALWGVFFSVIRTEGQLDPSLLDDQMEFDEEYPQDSPHGQDVNGMLPVSVIQTTDKEDDGTHI